MHMRLQRARNAIRNAFLLAALAVLVLLLLCMKSIAAPFRLGAKLARRWRAGR